MASHQKIVLYSCLINNRDSLKDFQVKDNFEYVLFTDDLSISSEIWDVRPAIWTLEDPTRTARYYKLHPFDLFPDADYAIWLDMSHWPVDSLTTLLTDQDVLLHKHHQRNTVKAEAETCAKFNLDDPQILKSQLLYYYKEGFPDNIGLYVTSCMVMKNTCLTRFLLQTWWEEICHWSKRDQVSFPYCLWKLGITPGVIPGIDRQNSQYFGFKSHRH